MIFNKTTLSLYFWCTAIYGDWGLGGVKAACGESLNVTPFHPVCLRKTLSLRLLSPQVHKSSTKCKPPGIQQEETGTLVTYINFWRRIIRKATRIYIHDSLRTNNKPVFEVCVSARAVSLPTNYITARLDRTDLHFSAYWSVLKDMRWVYHLMRIFWALCGESYAGSWELSAYVQDGDAVLNAKVQHSANGCFS